MLIGILSDSHGDHLRVRRTVALFDSLGVEHVIHCGDVGTIDVFDELTGRACHFVWGNCDIPSQAMRAYLKTVNIPIPDVVPLRLTLAGKRIAVYHGHEREANRMESTPGVDYVLHGHSHRQRDERFGEVRIVNPGALHRAQPKTVATLDLLSDMLTFHEVG